MLQWKPSPEIDNASFEDAMIALDGAEGLLATSAGADPRSHGRAGPGAAKGELHCQPYAAVKTRAQPIAVAPPAAVAPVGVKRPNAAQPAHVDVVAIADDNNNNNDVGDGAPAWRQE